ncbi:Ig-like domain repeat protein [Methanobrevibacter sp.]|uniref:Ig-like domain repeat protein n=1 Tax=Methanobrevibacter sp. TaxID=66852 RepID=UPI00388E3D19
MFCVIGAVSAVDSTNVSNTEDSNLANDNVLTLSEQNKLEISSEDSISATNIVNSHDDDLNNYPEGNVSQNISCSSYEDNDGILQASNDEETDSGILAMSLVSVSSGEDILSASSSKISTKLTVSDTHYSKSATYFKVTLKDKDGKALNKQKISLKVNGKTYTATTDSNGVASVKTAALAIGTYTVALTYGGSSNYASSSLSKKVKVLSSISGKDLEKEYGYVSTYNVTFWKNNGALANTKVSFTVNGKTYSRTTDNKGVAHLDVNLAPGLYAITSVNTYSGEKLIKHISVHKEFVTLKHGTQKTYVAKNTKYKFSVTLQGRNGDLVKDASVVFKFNNTKTTVKTNSKGVATLTIPALSKGSYDISYRFKGDTLHKGQAGNGKIYVVNQAAKLKASDLKMVYNDGSKFKVTVKDHNNKVLANKNVKFTLNGKTTTVKTNSKGVASLAVGNLKPATYTVKYQYSKPGSKDYNQGSKKITVSKMTAKITASNLKMKYNDGSYYKVTVKNKAGKTLSNVDVKFTVHGKTYTSKTDSKGVAKIKIGLAVGYYNIKSEVSNTYYKSSTVSKHILVNGTKFVASEKYVLPGNKVSYSVKLVDGKSNPIKNSEVKFTVDGKTFTDKTNSKGVAKISLGVLAGGNHKVKYSHQSFSGSSTIHVVNHVTLKQLFSASQTVKSYIKKNHKLPDSVKIGPNTYSTAQYLYLASKAIVNLKSGNKDSISVKDIGNPTDPKGASNLGNLNDYLSVAKTVVSYGNSHGKMPDSVNSKVGNIGYKGLVYAFSRTVDFYGDNGRLPSYVEIKSLSGSSSSGINPQNTIDDLTAYLSAAKNCQVNNSKIKALVEKLTKGLSSDKAKANAIFEYVRDTISYSFYYNTKHGAVGTLNAKSGNCVDHSHLLVAMYRTAGIPARYVHGSCTFSGGSTYGHVWAQVLIGNTWTVSDATSSRNSLGKVVNWNTNSYTLKGYSSSIDF